jgi:hypothetical protein
LALLASAHVEEKCTDANS